MLLPLARHCLQRRRRALRTLEAQPLNCLAHVRLQHERRAALAPEATGSHERERAALDDDGHDIHHVIVDARLHHPPLLGSKLYALHLKLQIRPFIRLHLLRILVNTTPSPRLCTCRRRWP
jgi:hypothetical protein